MLLRSSSVGQRLALALGVLLLGSSLVALAPVSSASGAAAPRPPSADRPCGVQTRHPVRYRSVVVFSFENRTWADVGGPGFRSMPYLGALAAQCSYLEDYTETNPTQSSLTQYVGATSGVNNSATVNDCLPSASCRSTDDNIFRQVRRSHRRAVNYVEDATRPCNAAGNAPRHVPALYYYGTYKGRSGATHNDHAHCRSEVRPYREFDGRHLP